MLERVRLNQWSCVIICSQWKRKERWPAVSQSPAVHVVMFERLLRKSDGVQISVLCCGMELGLNSVINKSRVANYVREVGIELIIIWVTFPSFSRVSCFPALVTVYVTVIPHLSSITCFTRAYRRLRVFRRSRWLRVQFPAFVTGYMFSHTFRQLRVFPRLALSHFYVLGLSF